MDRVGGREVDEGAVQRRVVDLGREHIVVGPDIGIRLELWPSRCEG